jgi:hypothetical protein
MRIILLAVLVASAVAGALAIHAASTKDTVDPYAREYLLMAQRAPDQLQELISAALPGCLDVAARPYIADTAVADLATKTLFKSGILMVEGKTAEQSSGEVVPYILYHARSFSPAQKRDFADLMKNGQFGPDTLLCVYSSVRAARAGRVDMKAIAWDLRR